MLDDHATSPMVIVAVWAGIIFGLGVLAGAALGWLASRIPGSITSRSDAGSHRQQRR